MVDEFIIGLGLRSSGQRNKVVAATISLLKIWIKHSHPDLMYGPLNPSSTTIPRVIFLPFCFVLAGRLKKKNILWSKIKRCLEVEVEKTF